MLALGAAFLASRIAWLLWNPFSGLYWEESYRWVAAHELLTAPIQPLLDYQADHYQGGSLVMILAAAGAFALVGESLLGFKVGALAFALATLVSLYALGRVWFGRAAAVVAGLVYLAGPPLVAHGALITMGSHGESTLFTLVQLLLFFGLLSGDWRHARTWVLFGLVSGLGLWFCYTSGLGLATCGLFWLLARGLPRPAELAWATAGLLVGLAPWLVYNLGHDFVGVVRILEVFGYGEPIDAWVEQSPLEKLRSLGRRDLFLGLLFPFGSGAPLALVGSVLAGFFLPFMLALWALLYAAFAPVRPEADGEPEPAGLRWRRQLRVLLAYAVLFVLVFLVSDFSIDVGQLAHGFRLFLPLAVILGFAASVVCARALEGEGAARRWAAAGLGVYLLASCTGTVMLASTRWEIATLSESEGFFARGVLVHRRTEPHLGRAFDLVRRVPSALNRYQMLEGIGFGVQYRFEREGGVGQVRRALAMLALPERAAFLRGVLRGVAERSEDLKELAELGDHPRIHRAARRRLLGLAGALRPDWEQLPPELRNPPEAEDRILVRAPGSG